MKHLVLATAIAAAVAFPAIAIAQTVLPQTLPAGMVVCRPMKAGETPNATMGKTELLCRAVDVPKANAAVKKIRALMAQQKPAGGSAHAASSTNYQQQMLQQQAELNKQLQPAFTAGGEVPD
jgi:hypothetical protein